MDNVRHRSTAKAMNMLPYGIYPSRQFNRTWPTERRSMSVNVSRCDDLEVVYVVVL